MREALTSEQMKQVIAEIDAWKVRNRAENLPKWQEAKIISIEQLVNIEEAELYSVVLLFAAGYDSQFLLVREQGRMESTLTYTYYAPEFTHPLQGK